MVWLTPAPKPGQSSTQPTAILTTCLTNQVWADSQAEALTLGGDLVTINDANENQWVVDTFATYGGTSRTIALGFNDLAVEGDWVWVSGESVTFTNWGSGQPDNVNGESYAYVAADGIWNDGQSGLWKSHPIHGVVEVVPEPATLSLLAIGGLAMLRRRK